MIFLSRLEDGRIGMDYFNKQSSTILRIGYSNDIKFIDSLRKKEGNALGFIPLDVYISILERCTTGNGKLARDRWKYCDILITEDNGEQTGYCFVSYSSPIAKIVQIVVRNDARRWHRALLMINKVEKDAISFGKHSIEARVAYDLESNYFWNAIGFIPEMQTVSTWLNQRESKSKRPLILYKKYLKGLF